MKYRVLFTYMDGQELPLDIHKDDIEDFMNSLSKSEVYFNKKRGAGFWVDIQKVRYFVVESVDEKGNRITD